MTEPLSKKDFEHVHFDDPMSLLEYAKKLEGHTFQEVLDLGIVPEGTAAKNLDSAAYKGSMGNLIEEHYFGYKANDNPAPDFEEAGVELKLSCYDEKVKGGIRAGERLVLGMIPFDEAIEVPMEDSHMWEKGSDILLIYYKRDKAISKFDQEISYALLFTPPEEDMAIIEEDYETIQRFIMEGRADELSESLTKYLGACTKGATAEKSMREQKVYAPGKYARARAWCYKNSYMDYVLQEYILGDQGGERIIKDPARLKSMTFEEYVLSLLKPYIGMRDSDIAAAIGLDLKAGNKSYWRVLAYRMLGLQGENAEEFMKASVIPRPIRIEENGSINESFPLPPFRFQELIEEESWEESELRDYFERNRFLFTMFEKREEAYYLKGAKFWSMPEVTIDGPLQRCWNQTRETVNTGVRFEKKTDKNGKVTIHNNLPGIADNPVAHVRPHTSQSAYLLNDGTDIGDIKKNGDPLPDGQWMTIQSFWLNSSYIQKILEEE